MKSQHLLEESTVLLQNFNDALPIKRNANGLKGESLHLLVVGNASLFPITTGTGSGICWETGITAPLWALCDELGIERFDRDTLKGTKCNKQTGDCISYYGYVDTTDSGPYVHAVEEEFLKFDPITPPPSNDPIYHEKYTHTLIFAGQESGEGGDRGDMQWNKDVFKHLKNFTSLGKVIGMMSSSGPIDLHEFSEVADALIMNFFGGMRYSEGITNILFGRINPSGKLPITIPYTWTQYNFTEAQFPGLNDSKFSYFTEKHHFGYRYFDQYQLEPLFPFGHGITYTKFEYFGLKIDQ